MSYDQEYFPPPGTKYKWHPKALNYSPWVCDISNQAMPDAPWPFRIAAFVEKSGIARWRLAQRAGVLPAMCRGAGVRSGQRRTAAGCT